MARLTNFSDFVGGDKYSYNPNPPKPYIYIIKYIMGKEDCIDELKEYILNYEDEESDYEDDDTYDPFMRKLKHYAKDDNIEEIEELVLNYEDFQEDEDFDSDDDDFEERLYDKEYVKDDDIFDDENQDVEEFDHEELNKEIEDSNLNDKLKDFLKVEIDFEDLSEPTLEEIEKDFDKAIEDVDFEEIINEKDTPPTWKDETFDEDSAEEEDLKDESEDLKDESEEEEEEEEKLDTDTK